MKTMLDYRFMEWEDYKAEMKILALRGALAWKKRCAREKLVSQSKPPRQLPLFADVAVREGI
jgi:hypothetical protein